MKCNLCGVECVGFPTGDPKEDICSDCAIFPNLRKISDDEAEAIEINHWRKTGEFEDGRKLFRERKV